MKLKSRITSIILCFAFVVGFSIIFSACNTGETNYYTQWGAWITHSLASCEEDGIEIRFNLDDPTIYQTRTVTAAHGHNWGDWAIKTAATCLVDGIEQRTCANCGNSDFRSISATGHNWGEWQIVLPPCCLSDGTKERVCLNNNIHTQTQSIPALGHDWSDWVVTLAPTALSNGTETRFCRNNNTHTQTRPVYALGLNWSDWVIYRAPTCTVAGIERRVSQTDSNIFEVRPIQARGHDFGEWTVHTAPSCLANGIEKRVCENCGYYQTRNIPRLNHNWGEWVLTLAPTENTNGQEIRFCRNNSAHSQTRVVHALGSVDALFFIRASDNVYGVFLGSFSATTVYIPAYHNGLPVNQIPAYAFAFASRLENVVFLGNNMRYIAEGAFMGSNIVSIEIPASVVYIGALAFSFNEHLENITFASGSRLRHIGAAAFWWSNNILSIIIPNTVLDLSFNPYYMWIVYEYVGPFYGWTDEQTIYILGFASLEEAIAVWGEYWLYANNANLVFLG